jgi:hypothetical protein
MPAAFAKFIESGKSAGVIAVPQELAWKGAIDDLLLIWRCI